MDESSLSSATTELWLAGTLEQMVARGRGSRRCEVAPHHRWIVDELLRRGWIENREVAPRYDLHITEEGRARISTVWTLGDVS